MKYLYLTVTILLLLNVLAPLEAQQNLKVLSYNLEGMKPGTDYHARLQAIIHELKNLNPDLLGLQEVAQHFAADNMARVIADSLTEYFGVNYSVYWQATHTAYGAYTEGLAIITKWPVVARGHLKLPQALFPRKVLWNQIDVAGFPVHFFTTHLAFRTEDNELRVQQVQALKSFIENQVKATPLPLILTGDFNCAPGSNPLVELKEYYSVWSLLHPTSSGHTYPASTPSRKIDHIFVNRELLDKLAAVSLEFKNKYDTLHYPSDHLGLMATFKR